MKYTKQNDETGCGIACLAMLAQRSYDEVLNITIDNKIKKTRKNLRLSFQELIKVGELLNLTLVQEKKPSSWKLIPGKAIVATDMWKNKKGWHWVVFDRQGEDNRPFFLDPFEEKSNGGEKRFDFRGKKCGRYLLLINKTE